MTRDLATDPPLDPPVDSALDPLAEFILDQSMAGIAVPVMLFGPDPQPGEPGPEDHRITARATAAELAGSTRQAAPMDLYTSEAYQFQCRVGRRLLDSAPESR